MKNATRSLAYEWDEAPVDPDPAVDLGYEHAPLSTIHVTEGREQYIFLPREDEHLADDEFLVTSPETVRSLEDWR